MFLIFPYACDMHVYAQVSLTCMCMNSWIVTLEFPLQIIPCLVLPKFLVGIIFLIFCNQRTSFY